MAIITNNDLVDGFSGKFGNDMVFRTMRGKTFASPPARKPDKKKESPAQRNTRVNFRDATQWAQLILLDPEKKAYYQRRAKALKLPNAYTAAITDYMRKPKVQKAQYGDRITYRVGKPGFTLQKVEVKENETEGGTPQKIATRQNKDRWFVHHTPDVNTAFSLTLIITDNIGRQIQFIDIPIEQYQN